MKCNVSKKVVEANLQCDFSERQQLFDSIKILRDKNRFTEYIDRVAIGDNIKSILEDLDVDYSFINKIMWLRPDLQKLETMAAAVRDKLRHKLAVDELHRRAVDGIEKPVYYKGKLVDRYKQYSDTMLKLMLTSGDPEKYSDKQQIQHSGKMLNLNIHGVVRSPK